MGLKEIVAKTIICASFLMPSYAQTDEFHSIITAGVTADQSSKVPNSGNRFENYGITKGVIDSEVEEFGYGRFGKIGDPETRCSADFWLREIVKALRKNHPNADETKLYQACQEFIFQTWVQGPESPNSVADYFGYRYNDALSRRVFVEGPYDSEEIADLNLRVFVEDQGSPGDDGKLYIQIRDALYTEIVKESRERGLFLYNVKPCNYEEKLFEYLTDKYKPKGIKIDEGALDVERILSLLYLGTSLETILETEVAPYVTVTASDFRIDDFLNDIMTYDCGELVKTRDEDSRAKSNALARRMLAPYEVDQSWYAEVFHKLSDTLSAKFFNSIRNPLVRKHLYAYLYSSPFTEGLVGDLVTLIRETEAEIKEEIKEDVKNENWLIQSGYVAFKSFIERKITDFLNIDNVVKRIFEFYQK